MVIVESALHHVVPFHEIQKQVDTGGLSSSAFAYI